MRSLSDPKSDLTTFVPAMYDFRFKQFTLRQDRCALKVGTDAVVLGAWADVDGARILDIGAGTGVLALMAAQRNPAARIDAVEIDDASAEQAGENAAASPWAPRVRVHRMDVRRLHADAPFDRILCNPPFYAGEMGSPDARTGVAKHGGGLRFAELLDVVDRMLAEQGRFACIIPLNREATLRAIAAAHGLGAARRCVLHYLEGRPPKRVLLELDRAGGDLREEQLLVEHRPGVFSTAYRALLAPFLLKF